MKKVIGAFLLLGLYQSGSGMMCHDGTAICCPEIMAAVDKGPRYYWQYIGTQISLRGSKKLLCAGELRKDGTHAIVTEYGKPVLTDDMLLGHPAFYNRHRLDKENWVEVKGTLAGEKERVLYCLASRLECSTT